MKSFMILFSGWKPGWVGPSTTYTLTVNAKTYEEAALDLAKRFKIEKVIRWRQLKNAQ